MLWYFDLFSQKSWFSKTNNCSFCNKTTQDFAEFWEIWVNFKAKTKTEDEGILRKGKRSSSWFFSLHIGLTERNKNQIFCYAKHAIVWPITLESKILQRRIMMYLWKGWEGRFGAWMGDIRPWPPTQNNTVTLRHLLSKHSIKNINTLKLFIHLL